MSTTAEAAPRPVDERVADVSALRRLLIRPESGAIAGAIAIWVFFALRRSPAIPVGGPWRGTASYLQVAAELGILAIAVALLMIGGEFDLSIGSMIGASGMIMALLVSERQLEHLAGDGCRAGLRAGGRRRQRLAGAAHRPAVVHHHASDALHPARR